MSKRPPTPADIIGLSSEDEHLASSAAGAAAAAAPAREAASSSATKPSSSSPEVISLLDDDDFCNSDNESDAIDRAMRASLDDGYGRTNSSRSSASGRAAKRQRRPFRASPHGVDDSMSSTGSGGGGGGGGVICLLSDSDDPGDEYGDDGGGKAGPSSSSAAAGGAKREAKREGSGGLRGGRKMNVDDSDDEVVEVAPTEPVLERFATSAGAAASSSARQIGGGDDDDEIEALGTSNVLRLPHARHDCTQHSFVEDVLRKKGMGQSQAARNGLEANKKTCDQCYCFVCDVPASDCESWAGPALTPSTAHCLASSRGINAITWTRLRDEKKKSTSSSSSAGASSASAAASAFGGAAAALQAILDSRVRAGSSSGGRRGSSVGNRSRRLQDELERLYGSRPGSSQSRAHQLLARLAGGDDSPPSSPRNPMMFNATRFGVGKGPFKADDTQAAKCNTLTQCRRCKWRSAFAHKNFTRKRSVYKRGSNRTIPHPHDVGEEDWCHACGRIASSKDLGKEQAGMYAPLATDVCLGTKTIPFRIKAHDPRKMDAFKKRWAENENKSPGWKYDEAEMEHDTFRHRIGSRPTLRMILASIPIVPEDEIPETGVVNNPLRPDSGWSSGWQSKKTAANECEALLISSRNHKALFVELDKFGDVLEKKKDGEDDVFAKSSNVLRANIQATWDKATRTGSFSITLFLRRHAFESRRDLGQTESRFALLLGCWFNVFPFTLAELTTGLKAKNSNTERRKEWMKYENLPLPPYRIREENERDELCEVTNEERTALSSYKASARAISDKLSFFSSAGSSSGGGISDNDSSLSGMLRRYFGEVLIDDYRNADNRGRIRFGWIGKKLSIVSHHRDMRQISCFGVLRANRRTPPGFSSYLRDKDHPLLMENVGSKLKSISNRAESFPGLMQHLENLGHKAAPQPEGINVELLDFQKQALGWAIERENNAGGLQSYLWVELPRQANGVRPGYSNKLYFSPVLDMFATQKPSIARGGLICQEMGLGKTCISLSLVLENPAPEFPESGTEVSGYVHPPNQSNTSSTPGWTKALKKAANAPKARGSIYSRGTLVVCNVSLVGQWIDEAKSKLKNPGLVYSYHGGSRTRDASILAQKSIVVTTYATLASDATYHARKSKNESEYTAPCEQVRWWRIICDESHVLRANSGNTKAVLRLEAENKFCVTGTPINTSVTDLRNQLSFIGLDKVDAMFTMFSNSMGHHNGKAGGGGRKRARSSWDQRHEIGPFSFLLRAILIRHTMEQKCRQSNRDLMSLPEKTERVIRIPFTADERAEYDKLETAARNAYTTLKAREGTQLSRHYLKLHSFLLPLRTACSGGKLPEDDPFKTEVEETQRIHQMQPGDDIECSICLDTLEDPRATQCQPIPHIFCKECIEGIIGVNDESSGPCPICRVNVVSSKLFKAILPKVDKDEGGAIGQDCKALFKSKFTRLLAELNRIRDNEPNAKSLVFSQFTSTLEWLKQELPKQGFQFRTLAGNMSMSKRAKALREFQNDPPTTIFLLSMRAGAVGINLTEANRVFLMEPALNPALEAQAIGRVHRLGQKHKVEVLRLVMSDSVETRMVKLSKKKYGAKDNNIADDNATSGCDAEEDESEDGEARKKDKGNGGKKKSPHKKAPDSAVAIGALWKDKAQMAAEEFDLLFGIDNAQTDSDDSDGTNAQEIL